jgi:predicted phage terminase large subunit-like protein
MAVPSSSAALTPSFKLTEKQVEANRLLASAAQHIMLFGGSRSGKTFLIVRAICVRALKAPSSRHVSLRFRFGHIRSSIVLDTFPKVMRLCFPQVEYELNKTDLFAHFANGSEYWFGGLDDKERTEKILGNEYATIHLNECSQIPWQSRNIAVTRLAQLVYQEPLKDETRTARFGMDRRPLPLKMYYDENPPDKGHWTYKLFKAKQDPDTRGALAEPEKYAAIQLNPGDNLENLGGEYLKTLQGLSARLQTRFLRGEFRETAPNALFIDEVIDRWRASTIELPEMLRIVVAVDPSGADDEDNQDNDEIGIVVCGLGLDGIGYVLEDLTCKAGPATWGRVATQAYERHAANTIVAEVNFGGAMVNNVIQSARPRTPFRPVTASRGKVVRAEPIASLCETGKVRLAGQFSLLEEELYGFTTHGYMGDHSPNRADAMIWGMSDLFPAILSEKKPQKPLVEPDIPAPGPRADGLGWMA